MFLDGLKLKVPIFQAPMAGVSTPELAAAVSNAGGLGALGLGASSWEGAAAQVSAFRALSDGPLHLNFFCHDEPERDATLETSWIARFSDEFDSLGGPTPHLLNNPYTSAQHDSQLLAFAREYRPNVISFHFGLPSTAILSGLRQLDVPVITSVTNLEDAKLALDAGIDGLIAQGIEAGGHRGTFDSYSNADFSGSALTTLELVQKLKRLTALPIVAAGGIMNGADVVNTLRLGAKAAQLGSAFLLCPESNANEDYKNQVRNASAANTVITRAISGRAARGIQNKMTVLDDKVGPQDIPPYPIAYDLSKRLHALALQQDESGYGAYWAGTGISKAREAAASELMEQLSNEVAREKAPTAPPG